MKLLIALLLMCSGTLAFAQDGQNLENIDINKMMNDIRHNMQGIVEDAKKCGSLTQRHCRGMNIDECMKKKSAVFPTHCRQQMGEFKSLQKSLLGSMKPCMDRAMQACPLPKDIDTSKGTAGLKKYQECFNNAMKSDKRCTDLIEQKVRSYEKSGDIKNDNDPYRTLIR